MIDNGTVQWCPVKSSCFHEHLLLAILICPTTRTPLNFSLFLQPLHLYFNEKKKIDNIKCCFYKRYTTALVKLLMLATSASYIKSCFPSKIHCFICSCTLLVMIFSGSFLDFLNVTCDCQSYLVSLINFVLVLVVIKANQGMPHDSNSTTTNGLISTI